MSMELVLIECKAQWYVTENGVKVTNQPGVWAGIAPTRNEAVLAVKVLPASIPIIESRFPKKKEEETMDEIVLTENSGNWWSWRVKGVARGTDLPTKLCAFEVASKYVSGEHTVKVIPFVEPPEPLFSIVGGMSCTKCKIPYIHSYIKPELWRQACRCKVIEPPHAVAWLNIPSYKEHQS